MTSHILVSRTLEDLLRIEPLVNLSRTCADQPGKTGEGEGVLILPLRAGCRL